MQDLCRLQHVKERLRAFVVVIVFVDVIAALEVHARQRIILGFFWSVAASIGCSRLMLRG